MNRLSAPTQPNYNLPLEAYISKDFKKEVEKNTQIFKEAVSNIVTEGLENSEITAILGNDDETLLVTQARIKTIAEFNKITGKSPREDNFSNYLESCIAENFKLSRADAKNKIDTLNIENLLANSEELRKLLTEKQIAELIDKSDLGLTEEDIELIFSDEFFDSLPELTIYSDVKKLLQPQIQATLDPIIEEHGKKLAKMLQMVIGIEADDVGEAKQIGDVLEAARQLRVSEKSSDTKSVRTNEQITDVRLTTSQKDKLDRIPKDVSQPQDNKLMEIKQSEEAIQRLDQIKTNCQKITTLAIEIENFYATHSNKTTNDNQIEDAHSFIINSPTIIRKEITLFLNDLGGSPEILAKTPQLFLKCLKMLLSNEEKKGWEAIKEELSKLLHKYSEHVLIEKVHVRQMAKLNQQRLLEIKKIEEVTGSRVKKFHAVPSFQPSLISDQNPSIIELVTNMKIARKQVALNLIKQYQCFISECLITEIKQLLLIPAHRSLPPTELGWIPTNLALENSK